MKPWKVLDSRRLYRHIRLDRCVLPDGNAYEVPVLEYRDWVTIVALTRDEQVVLERQYRHGLGQVILELPGGVMDAEDASPLEAAKRELLEETGYSGDDFVQVGCVSPDPASHTNHVHLFLAQGVEKVQAQHLDSTEELEVLLKPLDEVMALVRGGELPQALHVSALLLAAMHLIRTRYEQENPRGF